MDVDRSAGIYPDGTQVVLLDKRVDELFSQPRYKVRIGRAAGWVFEDELLTEEEWFQKKENGQYVPFQNHWHVHDNGMPSVDLYANGCIYDSETIGIVNEPSFTALGIYYHKIHVQLSNMDGYMVIPNCIADITRPDAGADHTIDLCLDMLERAVKKAKGTNQAYWTETERTLSKPFDPMRWTESREIEPTNCDISPLEAERLIWQALIEEGYVTNDTRAYFECVFSFLYYDYDDPTKHIWEFGFSDSLNPAEIEVATNILVHIDAHTRKIMSIDVCGP